MTTWRILPASLLMALLLAACGGGSDNNNTNAPIVTGPVTTPSPPQQEPGAPTLTGDNALDGYNWINYRRSLLGLSVLTRNSRIDVAAQGHSVYQRVNNTITHEQTLGLPGFTGVVLKDRLNAANYSLEGVSYAIGEVISATSNSSGFYQAEELITAIYHRFVMFEPVFREIGTGASATNSGYNYFTADFAVTGGYSGLGGGRFIVYPANNQASVPTNFFSDSESPDPVPGQNEVGYPISVHADIKNTVNVQSFTVAPRGGAALNVRLLTHATDGTTTESAAAIVPLAPLRPATTYDVSFSGTVSGASVSRTWSFSTK